MSRRLWHIAAAVAAALAFAGCSSFASYAPPMDIASDAAARPLKDAWTPTAAVTKVSATPTAKARQQGMRSGRKRPPPARPTASASSFCLRLSTTPGAAGSASRSRRPSTPTGPAFCLSRLADPVELRRAQTRHRRYQSRRRSPRDSSAGRFGGASGKRAFVVDGGGDRAPPRKHPALSRRTRPHKGAHLGFPRRAGARLAEALTRRRRSGTVPVVPRAAAR